jgi:hypothetical protein
MNDKNIKIRMEFASGEVAISDIKMYCIAKKKYAEVRLGITDNDKGCMIVPIADIKLYDSGLAKDADACFEDAEKLCEEIAKIWNAKQQIIKTLKWTITQMDYANANMELFGGDSPELTEAKELLRELTTDQNGENTKQLPI